MYVSMPCLPMSCYVSQILTMTEFINNVWTLQQVVNVLAYCASTMHELCSPVFQHTPKLELKKLNTVVSKYSFSASEKSVPLKVAHLVLTPWQNDLEAPNWIFLLGVIILLYPSLA